MKKIALFCSAALLALGFSSCEENPGLGIPQTNPQETVMSAGGITVDFGTALQADVLDLNDYAGQQIPVIKLALTDEEAAAIPAGADVEFVMELATVSDYSDATQLPVVDGAVSCEAWDAYFRGQLGKSPATKDNYVRFAAYLEGNGQNVRVGTPDTWFAAKQLAVTPIPMPYVIENAYYLMLDDNVAMFNHSEMDVYDDPVFTISVDVAEGGAEWVIAPESAKNSQNALAYIGVATEGDTALSGKLVAGGKAGKIAEAGNYVMTVNMEAMTYSIKKMSYLYMPGNSNGWSHGASQVLAYNSAKGCYEGYAHLDGEFKFTSEPNWDGTNYGSTGEEGKLSTDGGAGNLSVAQNGLYYCTVNVADLTYTATLITSYGAIGGFNGWGSQTVMTPSADFMTWTGEVTFSAGDEWKFRANDNWNINLGGEANNLVIDGGNLQAPGDGTYEVTLNLSSVPYTCSFTKK